MLNRANGKCEYCGQEGFLLPNGKRYIEAHHIISLANQGPDTMDNVIGLCANHHREAHFGKNSKKVEKLLAERLATIRRKH
ncbi:HNH endonuclease [Paraburkholderia sp.]|uniref:HNH endonuclease n=1 Tax=Paraburkholderia sp. TaxID=1926495 RepID=UPI00345D4907